jgi:hypothetical protein
MQCTIQCATGRQTKEEKNLESFLNSKPVCINFRTDTRKKLFNSYLCVTQVMGNFEQCTNNLKDFIDAYDSTDNKYSYCMIGLSVEQYELYKKIFG